MAGTDANWVNNTGGYNTWQDWWMADPLAASMSRTNDAFTASGLQPYYNTSAQLDPYYGGGGGQIINNTGDNYPSTNRIGDAVNTAYASTNATSPFFDKYTGGQGVYDAVYGDGGPYGSYENYLDLITNPKMQDGYNLFPSGADGFRPEGPAYGNGMNDLSGIYAMQQAYAASHPEMAWQPGTAGITGGTTSGTGGMSQLTNMLPANWTNSTGNIDPAFAGASGPGDGGTINGPNPYTTGGTTTGSNVPAASGGGTGMPAGYGTSLSSNPYLSGMADDIQRRTQQLLGENNAAITSNAIGVGGLGGSRQGVAQGIAAGRAADTLQGNLANLYGGAWNNQANRDLSRYGLDQNFYTAQRGQDLAGAGLGANIYTQGVQGGWIPIQNAANAYSGFTGFGNTTSTTNTGGGTSGLIGGLLSGATFGKNMGWW